MKLAWQLRQLHFDLAFVLDRSPMLTLLPWLANIPRRVGPDSLGRGFSLTDRVPVSTSRTQLQHQADIYLDLARALQLPIDHPHMRFVPTEAERRNVQQSQQTRVAVFPGGGSNPGMELTAKRWSLDGYREIVRRLVQDLHMQVLLIGGKEDFDLNEALLAPLDVPPGSVVNLAGQTQFGQTAAYLESCALFIGNDSSPMHLAAAVGTPVIAIFGPTSPEEYGPYPPGDPSAKSLDTSSIVPLESPPSGDVGSDVQSSSLPRSVGGYCNKHIAIWRHPTGQPCFFLGKMQTCEHCTCMSSVTVDDVWNAVQRLIPHNEHSEAIS
jgi:ADP-heptose:LPS heptosyltransferase